MIYYNEIADGRSAAFQNKHRQDAPFMQGHEVSDTTYGLISLAISPLAMASSSLE
jgi:hypothetical protein